ncbi:MAG: hypothetical protein OES47_08815 [Acidobacteriota bacterium]|nr:hypothetical protein [Acidobacteriota bacterium]
MKIERMGSAAGRWGRLLGSRAVRVASRGDTRVGWSSLFGPGMKRLLRTGILGITAALVLFHGRLLWTRLVDGSVLEPVVAARWLFGLVLAGLLIELRRRHASPLRGRSALVMWLLVVLLHAVALVPGVEVAAGAEGAVELLLVLPAGALVATVLGVGAALMVQADRLAPVPILVGRADAHKAPGVGAFLLEIQAARAPPA